MDNTNNTSNIIDQINSEDKEFLEKYQRLKRALRSFFKEEKLAEVIIDLINTSECFFFTSPRSLKYLDFEDPTFNVSIDWKAQILKYPTRFNTDNDVGDWKVQVLRTEILQQYMEIMTKALFQGDTSILDEIPYEEEIKKFVLINIFQINVTNEKDIDSKLSFRINI